jgi:hypothetical protein
MIPRNCLSYSLDLWHRNGGYFVARRSGHWGIAHAMHMSCDGAVTSYVPPDELPTPLHSLIGFGGEVVKGDNPEHARPMSLCGIVFSVWILALGATLWAIGRWLRRR